MELSDEFLSETMAAKFLGVSRKTLKNLASLRQGPPRVKIGRTILYRVDALRGWLLSQERWAQTNVSRNRRGAVR